MPATTCGNQTVGIGMSVLHVSQVDGILTITVSGGTMVTIDVAVPAGGLYEYRIWLSDSATDPTESPTVPTSQDSVVFEGFTNSNGIAQIVFENTGASHNWYPHGVFRRVSTGAVITAGA